MPKIKKLFNHKDNKHYIIINGEQTRNPELIGYNILDKIDKLPAPSKTISKVMEFKN